MRTYNGRLSPHQWLTEHFAQNVRQPNDITNVASLDLFGNRDPAVAAWINACSAYLGERSSDERKARFAALQDFQPQGLHWAFGDMRDYSAAQYQHDFPNLAVPDLGIMSFSAYCIEDDTERDQAIRDAVDNLSEDGVLGILDDVEFDEDGLSHIQKRNRNFGSCALWVIDKREERKGRRAKKLLRVKNGRCTEVEYTQVTMSLLGIAA